ncbi:MAG: hypothetical protein PHV93_02560 [Candidatus Pacebacteria bacterium]|nr:hypothetical protein [Candidatus Paceibacterota bacterium]
MAISAGEKARLQGLLATANTRRAALPGELTAKATAFQTAESNLTTAEAAVVTAQTAVTAAAGLPALPAAQADLTAKTAARDTARAARDTAKTEHEAKEREVLDNETEVAGLEHQLKAPWRQKLEKYGWMAGAAAIVLLILFFTRGSSPDAKGKDNVAEQGATTNSAAPKGADASTVNQDISLKVSKDKDGRTIIVVDNPTDKVPFPQHGKKDGDLIVTPSENNTGVALQGQSASNATATREMVLTLDDLSQANQSTQGWKSDADKSIERSRDMLRWMKNEYDPQRLQEHKRMLQLKYPSPGTDDRDVTITFPGDKPAK